MLPNVLLSNYLLRLDLPPTRALLIEAKNQLVTHLQEPEWLPQMTVKTLSLIEADQNEADSQTKFMHAIGKEKRAT